eukprot:Clim_evm167s157 gene=Clim_evmTU167s157
MITRKELLFAGVAAARLCCAHAEAFIDELTFRGVDSEAFPAEEASGRTDIRYGTSFLLLRADINGPEGEDYCGLNIPDVSDPEQLPESFAVCLSDTSTIIPQWDIKQIARCIDKLGASVGLLAVELPEEYKLGFGRDSSLRAPVYGAAEQVHVPILQNVCGGVSNSAQLTGTGDNLVFVDWPPEEVNATGIDGVPLLAAAMTGFILLGMIIVWIIAYCIRRFRRLYTPETMPPTSNQGKPLRKDQVESLQTYTFMEIRKAMAGHDPEANLNVQVENLSNVKMLDGDDIPTIDGNIIILSSVSADDPEEDEIRHEHGCTICLDIFEDKQEIRRLYCGHVFHTGCIDSWLLEKKKYCPLCKCHAMGPTVEDEETRAQEEAEISWAIAQVEAFQRSNHHRRNRRGIRFNLQRGRENDELRATSTTVQSDVSNVTGISDDVEMTPIPQGNDLVV